MHYRTNFIMLHDFHYSLDELESMIPFEREIYTMMLIDKLEKEKQKLQNR